MTRTKLYGLLAGILLIAISATVVIYMMRQGSDTAATASPAPTTTKPNSTYVALGDSVASGIGLAGSGSSICGRSDQGYPGLVAKARSLTLDNVTCSGASATQGVTSAQVADGQPRLPQLDRLPTTPPALITLTVGANDMDWINLMQRCYQGDCATPARTAETDVKLATLQANLTAIITTIKARYPTPPQLIVTGYYRVFDPALSCADSQGLSSASIAWINGRQEKLNDTIRTAVTAAGYGSYVEADFTGHELCSAEPWVQGLSDGAALHPNQTGAQAMADAVLTAYKR